MNLCDYFGVSGYANRGPWMGLECEVEAVQNIHDGLKQWHITEDGSLRNNGREFISVPMDPQEIVPSFTHLHAKVVLGPNAFSERTSVHVHVNCQALEPRQIINIIKMYALFEEVFFAMVDPSRRDNIHCVPLSETSLPNFYNSTDLNSLVGRWSKYTALNILPLKKYGTLEFRHLHGTGDAKLVQNWTKLIENLWFLGAEHPITKDSLTPDNIREWLSRLLKDVTHPLTDRECLQRINNSLLDVKLSVY